MDMALSQAQSNWNLGHNFLTGPLDDVLHGLENFKTNEFVIQ
ncbi:hypothetical protein OROMI_031620 [Orobanche minor]